MNRFVSGDKMSDYYHFDDVHRAIVFHRHDAPTPWINYLSNGELHAFVSQAGGGMLWLRSPLAFRLTRYRMYNLPIDSPGFYVYVRNTDGSVWSPSFRPVEAHLDHWSSQHQPGVTTFEARQKDIIARLSLWIMPDQDTMVWDLSLRNASREPVSLDVFAYVELSLFDWHGETDWGCYVKHQVNTWHEKTSDAMIYLFHPTVNPRVEEMPLVYLASTWKTRSYCGDRDRFVGPYRDERNPIAVERNHCGDIEMACGEPCAALQVKMDIAPGETSTGAFFLGTARNALLGHPAALAEVNTRLHVYRTTDYVAAQRSKLSGWWDRHLDILQCQIPDPDAQRQVNIWNPTQCVHTGRYSRSISFYAAGIRGVGFRDTCQDMLAIAYRKPDWAMNVFRFLLRHQFADGRAIHYAWPDEKRLPSNEPKSDNHLWLPILAHAILAETGDLSTLESSEPFLSEDCATPTAPATVWDHLMAGVGFTESHLGMHGLPLTLTGDWNDSIWRMAPEGRGQSVFAAQQYVYAMRLMLEMANASGKTVDAARLTDLIAKQVKTIEERCWDGDWWVRAFDDGGKAVGSAANPFGRIWLNSQSWAVLSGCGTRTQQRCAMDSAHRILDTDMGLVKLSPSFPPFPEVSNPYSGYSKGCGENGAIFCHANTWAIIAEAILGNAELAWKYYRQLIPHVAAARAGIERYQGEPYAYASNIVGPENNRFGWANVTQVTGTATWMDIAVTQYLLGIRPVLNGLVIDPCIPPDWPGYRVKRSFRGCCLDIEVNNPGGASKGVGAIRVDGTRLDIHAGPLIPADKIRGHAQLTIVVDMAEKNRER